MNPFWKKAKWDVISKEDLEKWREVEYATNYQTLNSRFQRLFAHLPPHPVELDLDELTLELLLDDEESWGDPQEEEFCAQAEWEWEVKHGVSDRIWASSMNQVLDESVDFSGDSELFFNFNEFIKKC